MGKRRRTRQPTRLEGTSTHRIYWITNPGSVVYPPGSTFDPTGQPPFKDAGGTPYPGLFDKALQEACDPPGLASGQDPPPGLKPMALEDLLTRATKKVQAAIRYKPDAPGVYVHPLEMYKPGSNNEWVPYYCLDHALLLRGLFQSVGVHAEFRDFWSGTSSDLYRYKTLQVLDPPISSKEASFQVLANAEDDAATNPHFRFHAIVEAAGMWWDPSYGKTAMAAGPNPSALPYVFLEAATVSSPYKIVPRDVPSGDPNVNKQMKLDPGIAMEVNTGRICDHVEP